MSNDCQSNQWIKLVHTGGWSLLPPTSSGPFGELLTPGPFIALANTPQMGPSCANTFLCTVMYLNPQPFECEGHKYLNPQVPVFFQLKYQPPNGCDHTDLCIVGPLWLVG